MIYLMSHLMRDVWIERTDEPSLPGSPSSHLMRDVWIERMKLHTQQNEQQVTSYARCVD